MDQEAAIEGYRLSPQQRESWEIQQESAACRAQCAVLLEGPVDGEKLQQALGEVVKRHEILRTTFQRRPERKYPLQVIAASGAVRWQEEEQRQWEVLYEDERHRRFDLKKGPLLRATLVRHRDHRQVLLLSLPGVCADAWTLKNLVHETGRAYAETKTAEEVTQYVQFSEWQHELLGDDDHAARRHWAEVNLELARTLTLPFEVRAAVPRAFDYETYELEFNDEVAAGVYAVAAAQGTTVGSIMLACWSVLLRRLTGQSELVVGVTVDGRKYEELHEAYGLFAKVVPLALRLKDEPFAEVLKQIEGRWRDAYSFQEYLSSETAAEPLVNFAYEERAARFRSGGVWFSLLRQEVCTERFKVRLTCARTGDRLGGEIHFDPHHLPAAEIARLAAQFQTLLKAALANPATLIGELEILNDAERRQLLHDFNDTRAEFRHDVCVHQLFEEQVERTPEATAVVCGNERLSYGELNARANKLAHYLRKLGVGPGSLVGICVDRSIAMLVGVLGVMKAGGAYVPLDPSYPKARLAFMLDDAKVSVLLTQKDLLEDLPEHNARVVSLDTDWKTIDRESEQNVLTGARADNTVYVIYTSGSTGQPKGVEISHRAVVNFLSSMSREPGLSHEDVFLAVTTLSFDIAALELYLPLMVGAGLILASNEEATDGELLLQKLNQNGVTAMQATPATWQILIAAKWQGDSPLKVICGGEALPRSLATQLRLRSGSVWNMYGPTETTIWSALSVVELDDDLVTIGRPIANTQIHLLDERQQPVPLGVAGELYIGGAGLAQSYLNRPSLTAEKFIPDAFGPEAGARLYHTGDLARYLHDGQIEFLGRIDQQVKLRGYRMELGEIETVLLQHDAVRQTAVVVQEGDGGQRRLVAFVITEEPIADGDKQSDIVNALRQHLGARVPNYMAPAVFVLLERLPLTPNGKVDRKALSVMEAPGGHASARFAVPRTPVEEKLVAIWREVLRVEQVGVHDNFFELGGDSILSIQIMARASQAGIRLTTRQLFDHPTVAALAAVAGRARIVTAEQGVVSGSLPLTSSQRAFFAEQHIEPQHFNQSLMLELRQPIDVDSLHRAFVKVVDHHDALRLRFKLSGDEWQQFNDETETHEFFTTVDLKHVAGAEQRAALEAHAGELQASLELSAGPLLRVGYYDLGAAGARLLIVIHHLAVDGVSWRILLEDVASGYEQAAAGKDEIRLAAKTTSYREWAKQLLAYAQSDEVGKQGEYWRGVAARARQVKRLPVDHGPGGNLVSTAASVEVSLSREETSALLSELPAVYRTEINEVLLTALVTALGDWTGEWRVLVELEGHGREEIGEGVDVTRTVGWFTTVYPVVLEVGAGAGVGEALKVVKEQVRGVRGRGLGWGLLRWLRTPAEEMKVEAELSFNYLGQFDQMFSESSPFTIAAESAGAEQSLKARRRRLIEIDALVIEGRLRVTWGYSRAVHDQTTIEHLAHNYVDALQRLIEHAGAAQESEYTPSDFPEFRWNQADLDEMSLAISASLSKVSRP